MQQLITWQHLGIVFTIIGTVLLAFSVQVKRQYQGEMAKEVDRQKREDLKLLEPTETFISRGLFWAGLIFLSIGAVLQW